MIDLKQALATGKLEQFIRERRGEVGDEAAFNRTVEAMAGKSKEAPAASSQDDCDD